MKAVQVRREPMGQMWLVGCKMHSSAVFYETLNPSFNVFMIQADNVEI